MNPSTVSALSCAERTLAELSTSWSGYVHSVFSHTINVSGPYGLLALQSMNSYETPFSVVLCLSDQMFERLNVSLNQRVKGDKKFISFCNIKIALQGCQSWKSIINHQEKVVPAELLFYIHQVIMENIALSDVAKAIENKADSVLSMALRSKIRKSEQLLRNGMTQLAMDQFIGLIGLGKGLTPSGDDFLVGFLSVLWRLISVDHEPLLSLRTTIRQHSTKTNDISSMFLIKACEGEFSRPIVNLLATKEIDVKRIQKFVGVIMDLGHSSGVDLLCGIYYGLRYFYEASKNRVIGRNIR